MELESWYNFRPTGVEETLECGCVYRQMTEIGTIDYHEGWQQMVRCQVHAS